MKTTLIAITILFTALSFSQQATAQKPRTGCNDVSIKNQGDGVKTGLTKQGLSLFQEAMISMQTMEPAPVVVKLNAGQSYQFIFVGDQDASRMAMELYDGKDKKVDEKVVRGGGNQIVYTYTAPKTDEYLITLMQKKRGRDNMCGYFGVMTNKAAVKTPRPTQQVPVTKTPAPVSNTKMPVKTTTTTTTTSPATQQKSTWQTAPANNTNQQQKPDYEQKPNPNRTKATQEHQNQKKPGQQ